MVAAIAQVAAGFVKNIKPKPSRWGSVLGTPLKTVVGGNGERWWGGGYAMVVVAGW